MSGGVVLFGFMLNFLLVSGSIKGFPGGSVLKNLPAVQDPGFNLWVRKIPWERKWLPTSVFLPGKFCRQRSLAGYSPWGHKEWDMAE